MADSSVAGGWQPGGGPSDRRDMRFAGLTDTRDEEALEEEGHPLDPDAGSRDRFRYDDEDDEDDGSEDYGSQDGPQEPYDDEEEREDVCMKEWEENLAEWARLDKVLKEIHPKLQDTRKMIVDKELTEMVNARKNPTLKFTGKLMCGIQPYMHNEPVEKGSWKIPRLIVVTGHKGKHGNIGINGIYERHPDDHHSRPVYCKTLTKRTMEEDPFMSRTEWRPRTMKTARIPALPPYDGPVILGKKPPGAFNYFLYFDNTQGCWCIGPEVGERRAICARSPGCTDVVPVNLLNWECWDVGLKKWYWHRGLQAIKGGK